MFQDLNIMKTLSNRLKMSSRVAIWIFNLGPVNKWRPTILELLAIDTYSVIRTS